MAEVPDTLESGLFGHLGRVTALQDNLAYLVGHRHDLVDAGPALVAGNATRAADRSIDG